MAITLVGSGTGAEGSLTCVPTEPANLRVGDMLFCLGSNGSSALGTSGDPTMSPLWRQIYAIASNNGLNTYLNGTLYYCRFNGTSPDYTVTGKGTVRAIVFAYRNCAEVPFSAAGGTGTGGSSSATVNYPSGLPSARNQLILWTWHFKAPASNGAIDGTTPTPVEELDDAGTTLSDGFADALQLEPTSTGARTSTASSACNNIGAITMLLEETAPSTATVISLPPNQRYA